MNKSAQGADRPICLDQVVGYTHVSRASCGALREEARYGTYRNARQCCDGIMPSLLHARVKNASMMAI